MLFPAYPLSAVLYAVFRLVFFFAFTGLHLALMTGALREWFRNRRIKGCIKRSAAEAGGAAPLVSVIVPFRNEERRMEGLLKTLALQDYPNLEFVFVDDRSTDRGPELLRDFAEKNGRTRIITLRENPGENPKQFAMGRGIGAAGGGYLLFTDGDCELPPSWAGAMMKAAAEEGTGIVIGPVFKKKAPGTGSGTGAGYGGSPGEPLGAGQGGPPRGFFSSFFSAYQRFDHAVRYFYLMASTGLGQPGGGFGNNLLVKREVLDAAGGYAAVPPSPTEDASLIALARPACRIRAASDRALWVMTAAEPGWGALLGQTLRWNNGGLFSPDRATRLNFNFLMIAIGLGVLALPLLPFFPSLRPLSLAVLLSMGLNTIGVYAFFGGALRGTGRFCLLLWVFTPVYFTFLTVLGFLGVRLPWKDMEIQAG